MARVVDTKCQLFVVLHCITGICPQVAIAWDTGGGRRQSKSILVVILFMILKTW